MARSEFQRFMPKMLRRLQTDWPFVQRFEKSFCMAIPKSSSVYCGVSPRYGKHVVVDFQHSSKAWQVGEFTVNVHVSAAFAPTANWGMLRSGFESFEDGHYRLAVCVEDKDRWWCLRPDPGKRANVRLVTYWEADSYEDPDQVFAQCADHVSGYLGTHLFRKAGFVDS